MLVGRLDHDRGSGLVWSGSWGGSGWLWAASGEEESGRAGGLPSRNETFKKTEIKDRTSGLKSELRFKKRPQGKDVLLENTNSFPQLNP